MARRVALLLPRLLGGGGLDRTTMRLAEGFVARGLAVDVVCVDAAFDDPAPSPEGVRVLDLEAGRAVGALPGLVRYLRRERPWALLGAMPVANLLALAARDAARVPTQVMVKEHIHVSSLFAHDPGTKTRLLRALLRRGYARAEAVVAISEGVADDLHRVSGLARDRIEVIHNPVVTPSFFDGIDQPVDHPWFDDPSGPPVLLTVARLSPQKDLPTLLEAFRRVRRGREARLVVVGEGPQRAALENEVRRAGLAGDVWMPGFVATPQHLMARADAFVLSSRYEGLGNVLVEALAAGAPVVSTDCPSGPREILRDGELGRLVPVGDAVALAAAIEQTLDDPPPPASSDAWRAFETRQVVDRYLALLERADRSRR